MTTDRPNRTVIRDVALIDATGREAEGRVDALVEDGRIARLGVVGEVAADVAVIDGAGTTLTPGLTDAHVHFALVGVKGDHGSDAWITHVLTVAEFIESAVQEGFTTVRDAGGLEPAWAQAVTAGKLRGPRILPAGSPLSQTGGHADDRQRHEALHHSQTIPGLVAGMEVVDGVDEVRRAAFDAADRAGMATPAGAAGLAAFFSGDSLAPPDSEPAPPPEGLAGRTVAGCVHMSAAWGEPEETTDRYEDYVRRGVELADRVKLWEPPPGGQAVSGGASDS